MLCQIYNSLLPRFLFGISVSCAFVQYFHYTVQKKVVGLCCSLTNTLPTVSERQTNVLVAKKSKNSGYLVTYTLIHR